MAPEALLSIWRKASCSPCMSLMKCSVPFGRLRMASSFIISAQADCTEGNSRESKVR